MVSGNVAKQANEKSHNLHTLRKKIRFLEHPSRFGVLRLEMSEQMHKEMYMPLGRKKALLFPGRQ